MDKRRVIGKATKRLDGAEKSTGRAKYTSDFTQKDLLFGALLTSPHAHARVTSIDTSDAEKLPGVTAVRVIASPGTELMWAGQEVASVAARNRRSRQGRHAQDQGAVRSDAAPGPRRRSAKAGARAKAAGEQVTGDPDKAFQEADVTVEGQYGIPVITHCCLEPHGNVIEWNGDTHQFLALHAECFRHRRRSGQQPQGSGNQRINVHMQYIGGGFGSKFATDLWGVEAAQLSKASGGQPVKLFLDRATELIIAGNRPSAFAKIKVGGEEGRHHHGVAIGIVVDRRHRRRRQPAPSLRVRHSQPAQEPHGGFDQLRRRARLARSQSPAGLLPDQLRRSRIWRPS